MNKIPACANGYTAADILRMAAEHDVPGVLVSRGRKCETRAYAVEGFSAEWKVTAPREQHYTGRQ